MELTVPVPAICPHCARSYYLGINGIETGCDECLGIVRNPIDHTVVEVNVTFPEPEEA